MSSSRLVQRKPHLLSSYLIGQSLILTRPILLSETCTLTCCRHIWMVSHSSSLAPFPSQKYLHSLAVVISDWSVAHPRSRILTHLLSSFHHFPLSEILTLTCCRRTWLVGHSPRPILATTKYSRIRWSWSKTSASTTCPITSGDITYWPWWLILTMIKMSVIREYVVPYHVRLYHLSLLMTDIDHDENLCHSLVQCAISRQVDHDDWYWPWWKWVIR